jgi:hypothetical protein
VGDWWVCIIYRGEELAGAVMHHRGLRR